jgi:ferredoxin
MTSTGRAPSSDSARLHNARDYDGDFDDDEELPAPRDYYQLLNVKKDASSAEIRKAYRNLTKHCHPDIAGKEASDVSVLVTSAYKTLVNPQLRSAYDKEVAGYVYDLGGYTGKPLSKWRDDPGKGPNEQRAMFVDESHCIGCRMCVSIAKETFRIEERWGRAKVHTQWGNDEEDIDSARAACPVNCIHFVSKEQLPLLEWCQTRAERGKVAMIMAGRQTGQDPFDLANSFVRNSHRIRERLRGQGRDDTQWIWGAAGENENQLAFAVDMQQAWNKLPKKTKKAWTFQPVHDEQGQGKVKWIRDFGHTDR